MRDPTQPRSRVLVLHGAPSGGFREAAASVRGEGVYGSLKYENGVHRVRHSHARRRDSCWLDPTLEGVGREGVGEGAEKRGHEFSPHAVLAAPSKQRCAGVLWPSLDEALQASNLETRLWIRTSQGRNPGPGASGLFFSGLAKLHVWKLDWFGSRFRYLGGLTRSGFVSPDSCPDPESLVPGFGLSGVSFRPSPIPMLGHQKKPAWRKVS